MRALILCDGQPPGLELLARHRASADLIIATDGAVRWVVPAGISPDLVIGDGDSLPDSVGDWEAIDAGAHETQENSDAEKALLLALERGATEVVILGATGQRLDHTLANVWLVARYRCRAALLLADDWGETRVTGETLELAVTPGAVVSLVPLTPDVVVRTAGLQWPLDEPLEPGTRGLSNVAVDATVTLTVAAGLVAVILVTE